MRGFCRLTNQSFVSVTGKDSGRFLNNVSSNDVSKLGTGDGLLAGFLTRQGKPKFVSDIKMLENENYLLRSEGISADKVIEFLQKYIISERVEIADVTSKFNFYLISSDREENLPGIKLKKGLYSYVKEKETLIFRLPYSSKADIGIISENELLEWLYSLDIDRLADADLEKLRIEYGCPVWGAELSEEYLLQEGNLTPLALSYNKGCYPGQEVVLRLKTYGELSRKLMLIRSEKEFEADRIILENKEIGNIVSSVNGIGLGYIKKPYYKNGEITGARCGNAEVSIRRTGFEIDFS